MDHGDQLAGSAPAHRQRPAARPAGPRLTRAPDLDRGGQLGALVKLYRTKRGFTQRQLAGAAGVSLGTVRDLEQGRFASPRREVLESVAAVLDLDQHSRTLLMRARQAGATVAGPQPADGSGWTAAPVRVEVLGPLVAWAEGAAVPLGSLRQRAVLGLLALHTGAGLHRDAIIDVLWGTKPPASAVTQVHGYVSRLRKLLAARGDDGESAELICTVGAGYRLQAGRDQLDLAVFRQILDRAGRAAAQDRLAEACDLYEQALGLWRGDVLADIQLLRGHPAATELACRRSDAVVRYAGVAMRTAFPQRALPHLRELCAREGFNEAAHAHLMIALAAAGQQVAALDAFAALRRRLINELGLGPGPQLVEVQIRILRQHRSVLLPQRP